jgi:hypothetical protein
MSAFDDDQFDPLDPDYSEEYDDEHDYDDAEYNDGEYNF